MDINPGDIVYSDAGRDKDKPFVVISLEEESFAFIADGKLRKASKPKKKKIKHLKKTGKGSDYVKKKISDGLEVTNRELKKAISEYLKGTDAV